MKKRYNKAIKNRSGRETASAGRVNVHLFFYSGVMQKIGNQMSSKLNQELYSLYVGNKSKLYGFGEKCSEIVHGPFLVSPNSKYCNSKIRVVFVGQETNGWSCNRDIRAQMETYLRFNLGENYYSSPFWNVIRKFEKSIVGEVLSSSWLNINRYDEDGKKPSAKNQLPLAELDGFLLSELEILSPDVTIFLTGHSYDHRIIPLLKANKRIMGNFDQKKVCELQTDLINGRVFRTYHPKYLRISGLEKIVIEEITSYLYI